MNTKFSIGDVVRLTSGGPNMTVLEVQVLSQTIVPISYKVGWFNDQDRVMASNFPEAALEKVKGKKK